MTPHLIHDLLSRNTFELEDEYLGRGFLSELLVDFRWHCSLSQSLSVHFSAVRMLRKLGLKELLLGAVLPDISFVFMGRFILFPFRAVAISYVVLFTQNAGITLWCYSSGGIVGFK